MTQSITKPNILFILTDQQRTDTLQAYGSKLCVAPNIDRLAREGVVFERAYCSNPLCMPSRAAMLTGRHSSVNGVRTNGCMPHSGQPLLPELLRGAGYRTAAFGKLHYHPMQKPYANQGLPEGYYPENVETTESAADLTQPYLGFETIKLATGHGEVCRGLHMRHLKSKHPEALAGAGPDAALQVPDRLLHKAQKIETYQTGVPVEHYTTTWITDQVVEYVEQTEEPFFIWCGFPDPHHPFTPPGKYWSMFDPDAMPLPVKKEGEWEDKPPHFHAFGNGSYKGMSTDGFLLGAKDYLEDRRVQLMKAAYCGMIALIDDSIGRILDTLRKRGLSDNTIIIFASDHGELLGDHGFILKGPMHYESLLRVPFIWHGPERFIRSGRRIGGLVSLLDLFPTLVELAGVAIPEGTQGRSLICQLEGTMDRGFERVLVEDDSDALGLRLRTMVTESWRITCYADKPYGEIYDLEKDPSEFVNIWNSIEPNKKIELLCMLLDLIMQSQSGLPPKLSHA